MWTAPRELVLDFQSSTVGNRYAYWGDALIGDEADGAHFRIGPIPSAVGQWVRLEVPASLLHEESSTISQMVIEYVDGQAWFDHIGKAFASCIEPAASHPAVPSTDVVWIDERSDGSWGGLWDSRQKVSGNESFTLTPNSTGVHATYAGSSAGNLSVSSGDTLVLYTMFSECGETPPRELVVAWSLTALVSTIVLF